MKSRLLDRRALEDLMKDPDISSMIVSLEKMPYAPEINEAGTKYSGIYVIEYALRKNFTKSFKKILDFLPEGRAKAYLGVFLQKWDIQNIKTILRGKSFHITQDEIFECLVPAGDLDDVTLGEMIKQPDVRAVIDLLATWGYDYARPLTAAYAGHQDGGGMIAMESALDGYYYKRSLETVSGDSYDERLVRNILQKEIDTVNIKTALRMVRDRISPADASAYILEGGKRLRMGYLLSLLDSRTLDDAVKKLKGTSYDFLSAVPEEHFKHEKVSEFEKRLDRYLASQGLRAYHDDPLSIAIAIGYFWAKYNEIMNIRIIARCKLGDISDDSIRSELFYV